MNDIYNLTLAVDLNNIIETSQELAATLASSSANHQPKANDSANPINSVAKQKRKRTRKSGNDQEADQGRKRVKSYCPKDKNIKLELHCELDECNQCFYDMDSFLDHIDNHLNDYFLNLVDQTIFECKWSDCDSNGFDCASTFKRHVRYHAFHTKLKQIGLSVLNTNNETSNEKIPRCNLDEQTRNVIPELPYKFECSWNQCEYKTDNPELFYRHIRAEHVLTCPAKIESLSCKWGQCGQIITNKNRFAEHLRHHSQEKLVACPNCGALFASFTKFIDHCNRSSDFGNLCFQCTHCNRKFATNNLLKEHTRKHVNKCKCPICDMTCFDKNDLNKHILYKHTTQKSLKCPECDHRCKTQNDLQKHISLKHEERNEYQCNECEFKSKDLNIIRKHMYKSHLNGERNLTLNDGQQFSSSYMCHVCNKVYTVGSTLSKHLKAQHNFEWPSGHSRFRYKLEADGFYRLQTLRYESIELTEQMNKDFMKSSSISGNDEIDQFDQLDQTSQSMMTNATSNEAPIQQEQNQNVADTLELTLLNSLSFMNNLQFADQSNEVKEEQREEEDDVDDEVDKNEDDSDQIDLTTRDINSCVYNNSSNEQIIHQNDLEYFYTSNRQPKDNPSKEISNEMILDLNKSTIETPNMQANLFLNQQHLTQQSVFSQQSNEKPLEFDLEHFLHSNFQRQQQQLQPLQHLPETQSSYATNNTSNHINLNFNNCDNNSLDDPNMKVFFIERLMTGESETINQGNDHNIIDGSNLNKFYTVNAHGSNFSLHTNQ